MSEINTGGPAFPVPEFPMPGGQTFLRADLQGMTLRDYFAAGASEEDIQEWVNVVPKIERVFDVGNGHKQVRFAQPSNVREIARYMHADAMLKARQGGQA